MTARTRRAGPSPVRLVALAAGLMFFYGCLLGGMQLVMGQVSAYYDAGTSGIGFLVSAQYWTAILMPAAMGAAADRLGKKPVLVLFTGIFGAGCLLAGLSQRLGVYIAGACLIGAGYSVCESLSSATLTDFGGERAMGYVNLTQCLLSVGAIVSPLLLQYAAARWNSDWRLIFLICAAAFAILTAALAATAFPAPSPGSTQTQKGIPRSVLLLCLMAAIVLYVGLENGFGYFVESYFSVRLDRSDLAAAGISAYWAGMALSRLLCGMRVYGARKMLLICFAAAGVLFAALALWKNGLSAVALCGLVGFAFGPIWSTLVTSAARAHPRQAGAAIGIMSTGCGLGGVLYPPLMGAVASHFSLTTAFWMLAGTAVLAGVLCLRVRQ